MDEKEGSVGNDIPLEVDPYHKAVIDSPEVNQHLRHYMDNARHVATAISQRRLYDVPRIRSRFRATPQFSNRMPEIVRQFAVDMLGERVPEVDATPRSADQFPRSMYFAPSAKPHPSEDFSPAVRRVMRGFYESIAQYEQALVEGTVEDLPDDVSQPILAAKRLLKGFNFDDKKSTVYVLLQSNYGKELLRQLGMLQGPTKASAYIIGLFAAINEACRYGRPPLTHDELQALQDRRKKHAKEESKWNGLSSDLEDRPDIHGRQRRGSTGTSMTRDRKGRSRRL